jgi:chromosome segregation ATPase
MGLIKETQDKLETVNNRLRDVIMRSNSSRSGNFANPPSAYANGGRKDGDSMTLVRSQLEYLEVGLAAAIEDQASQASTRQRENEAAASMAVAQAEGRVEDINRQVQNLLLTVEPDYPEPPDAVGAGLDEKLDYLLASLNKIETELSRASQMSSSRQAQEQVDTVLMGLWDIIQSGYAGIQRRKAERRKTRMEMGLEEDDDEMSADEDMNTNETYSLQAFSTKVQWLYAQATSLKEQKTVLKRQIKQQRELNNRSGSEKDLELQQKSDELARVQALLATTERDAKDSQDRLNKTVKDLETQQASSAANVAASTKASDDQIKERNAKISSLESNNQDLKTKLTAVEASVAAIQTQLSQASESKRTAEATVGQLQKDIKQKDEELERMNVMVAELKTEVTIAKAELEGAYGSRAQRAAEAAALNNNNNNNNKSGSTAELSSQVDQLRTELASTLKEFEDMTKETIAAEKEKLELEGKLDDAMAARTRLESQVAMLQEKLDAEKLKVPAASAGGAPAQKAGATMLSEQFRATMKEERKKFQEELRVCLPSNPPISFIRMHTNYLSCTGGTRKATKVGR